MVVPHYHFPSERYSLVQMVCLLQEVFKPESPPWPDQTLVDLESWFLTPSYLVQFNFWNHSEHILLDVSVSLVDIIGSFQNIFCNTHDSHI